MNRRGMTLIELLVGMALACMVTYLAFDLITGENKNYTRTRNKVRLQSDAREATRIIEEDLSNLGFSANLKSQKSRFATELDNCGDTVLAASDRLSIGDGAPNSDTLIIRQIRYELSKDTLACGEKPIEVRYYVDADNKLVRLFGKQGDDTAKMTKSFVLSDVVTFQARAGLDPSIDTLVANSENRLPKIVKDSTKWTTFSGSDLVIHKYNSIGSDLGPAAAKIDSSLTVTGWTPSSVKNEKFYTATTDTFTHNATYHVGFWLLSNFSFQEMLDTTANSGDYLAAGIQAQNAAGFLAGDSVVIRRPKHSFPVWVSFYFTPTANIVDGQFGIKARLSKTNTAPEVPTVGISGLRIVRVENAHPNDSTAVDPNDVYVWRDSTSKFADRRRQTKAVRVWLLAQSQRKNQENAQSSFANIGNWKNASSFTPTDTKSYALYERILPVVNHGYNPNK